MQSQLGIFNIPLLSLDRSSRQKFNKETAVLNNTVDQLISTEHFATKKQIIHTFQMHMECFFRIDYMIGLKRSLNKFKKTERNHIKHLL